MLDFTFEYYTVQKGGKCVYKVKITASNGTTRKVSAEDAMFFQKLLEKVDELESLEKRKFYYQKIEEFWSKK